jgi:hypothetical protein
MAQRTIMVKCVKAGATREERTANPEFLEKAMAT